MKLALAFLALFSSSVWAQSKVALPPRIILFIMDDVGADSLAQVPTPNIDALAARGIQFTRAYAHPWCKPSRDSLLRGSYAGVVRGEACLPVDDTAQPTNADTFVGTLREAGYLTGLVGKWHAGRALSNSMPWWFAPQSFGFDHWWAGTSASTIGSCNPGGLNNFDDGIFTQTTKHATVLQRDRLFDLMDEANQLRKPLFAWVGFTDAHSPWTAPPFSLLAGYFLPARPRMRHFYEAEIVAMDTAIGQIVAGLPINSWIIVTSENGTPEEVTLPRTTRSKLTVYERGVRVPMIFSGPGLVPGVCDDPVSLYDLPATLLANLQLGGPHGDGRNILGPAPERPFAFVQNPSPGINHSRALIEKRFKLIENNNGLEFYDLSLDPMELAPLQPIGPEFERLKQKLAHLPSN